MENLINIKFILTKDLKIYNQRTIYNTTWSKFTILEALKIPAIKNFHDQIQNYLKENGTQEEPTDSFNTFSLSFHYFEKNNTIEAPQIISDAFSKYSLRHLLANSNSFKNFVDFIANYFQSIPYFYPSDNTIINFIPKALEKEFTITIKGKGVFQQNEIYSNNIQIEIQTEDNTSFKNTTNYELTKQLLNSLI
jgi:hypothetical protein